MTSPEASRRASLTSTSHAAESNALSTLSELVDSIESKEEWKDHSPRPS